MSAGARTHGDPYGVHHWQVPILRGDEFRAGGSRDGATVHTRKNIAKT